MVKEESFLIEDWQCGYPADISKWPYQGHCKKSSLELLNGFFKFYAKFDYEAKVLSPYNGAPVEKDEIHQTNVNKEEAATDTKLDIKSCLCLQVNTIDWIQFGWTYN